MATCYSNQLEQTLRQALPTVLLLWGEDAGALKQSAAQAVALSGIPVDDPFRAESFSLQALAASPSRLTDSAGTLTLDGGRRLIRLSSVSGDESESLLKPLTESIEAILAQPAGNVFIVLPIPALLEKTSALVKAVEKAPHGLSVRFFAATGRDLATWLQNEFNVAGKRLEGDALGLLTTHLGADREHARREVEKLLLYVGEAPTITHEHVLASLAGAIPADSFRLAEAVGRRDLVAVDRLLTHLLEEGDDLNAAFSLTLRHLNGLKTAQQLKQAGQPDETILAKAGKLKAPPQARTEFLNQVNRYPAGRLATLPAYALETLSTSRGGIAPGPLTLARAILALSA